MIDEGAVGDHRNLDPQRSESLYLSTEVNVESGFAVGYEGEIIDFLFNYPRLFNLFLRLLKNFTGLVESSPLDPRSRSAA